MRFYEYLRRTHSGCSCDTTATDVWDDNVFGGTNYSHYNHNNCPYCVHTSIDDRTKKESEEQFHKEQEIKNLFIMELGRMEYRIRRKVDIPILPQNVINKTMNRRMMNGRH